MVRNTFNIKHLQGSIYISRNHGNFFYSTREFDNFVNIPMNKIHEFYKVLHRVGVLDKERERWKSTFKILSITWQTRASLPYLLIHCRPCLFWRRSPQILCEKRRLRCRDLGRKMRGDLFQMSQYGSQLNFLTWTPPGSGSTTRGRDSRFHWDRTCTRFGWRIRSKCSHHLEVSVFTSGWWDSRNHFWFANLCDFDYHTCGLCCESRGTSHTWYRYPTNYLKSQSQWSSSRHWSMRCVI